MVLNFLQDLRDHYIAVTVATETNKPHLEEKPEPKKLFADKGTAAVVAADTNKPDLEEKPEPKD